MDRRDFIKKATMAAAGAAVISPVSAMLHQESNKKCKVLLVNGSPRTDGNTFCCLKEIEARYPLTDAAVVLFIGPPGTKQACCGFGNLPTRRCNGHTPNDEHDVRDDEYARGDFSVLEHRIRRRKGRSETRHRGHADHAHPGHQHGISITQDPC